MNRLEQLWLKGKDFLGVEYPIMAGAMTWISDHKLVSAVSNAGGFGCLAAGNLPPDILVEEIDKTRRLTDKPFATNLITIAPNYRQHLEIAVEKKVPFIIFAGSFPRIGDQDRQTERRQSDGFRFERVHCQKDDQFGCGRIDA